MIPLSKLPLRQRLSLFALRGGLASLNVVSTKAAARAAERLFLKPPPAPYSRNLAGEGVRRELATPGGRAIAWTYGSGPAIYLLHGWGGRGYQLSGLVAPLVAAGRQVVLLDAPGHGEVAGGQSSVVAFGQALQAAVDAFGPASGVVAHSLGALSTLISIGEGLRPQRLVFLAPGSSLDLASQRFQEIMGLRAATLDVLKRQLEEKFQRRWSDYDLSKLPSRPPLWIAHDPKDEEVPIAESHALLQHWPGATLMKADGLGHYRLLRNGEVVRAAVGFLTA